MTPSHAILAPVVALVAWTHVMWAWMYATRIPATVSMKLDSHAVRGEQMATLPSVIRWKADNYNHLMEQPTLFYAIAVVLAIVGAGTGTNLVLAWTYVAMRVVHSLVQSLGNKIIVRFAVFFLSSLVLVALTVRAALVFV